MKQEAEADGEEQMCADLAKDIAELEEQENNDYLEFLLQTEKGRAVAQGEEEIADALQVDLDTLRNSRASGGAGAGAGAGAGGYTASANEAAVVEAYGARDAPWKTDAGGSPPPGPEGGGGDGGGGGKWRTRTSTGEPTTAGSGRERGSESGEVQRTSYGERVSSIKSAAVDAGISAFAYFADRYLVVVGRSCMGLVGRCSTWVGGHTRVQVSTDEWRVAY